MRESDYFPVLYPDLGPDYTTVPTIIEPARVMTVQDLIDALSEISDRSTPIYLENGNPVHYTCFGMNQNETRFFIGVLLDVQI